MTTDKFDFLSHRGELATLIRNLDWSLTSLGWPSGWPEAIKVTISTIL